MIATSIFPVDIDLARASLEHWTAARAVNYLTYTFDASADEIIDLSDAYRRDTTLLEYAQNHVANSGGLANNTCVVFWGGPPGDGDWYKGTLLDMLIDRVLFKAACGNDVAVHRFIESC